MSDSDEEFDEPTTTLADDFLADLDELDSGDEDEADDGGDGADGADGMDVDVEALVKDSTVKGVAKLMQTPAFTSVVEEMQQFLDADGSNDREIVGPLEEDEEYKLIVRMNELSADIDNEILLIHKFVRDLYATKFPELENLIANAVDYARVVKEIANEMDMTMVNLEEVLPSATIMVVSVTGSTTAGKPLSEDELGRCIEGCDEMLTVFKHRTEILAYVESRMTRFAPNISVLIGASLSARMIGLAGGLTALSKIPSCNVQVRATVRLCGCQPASQPAARPGSNKQTIPDHGGAAAMALCNTLSENYVLCLLHLGPHAHTRARTIQRNRRSGRPGRTCRGWRPRPARASGRTTACWPAASWSRPPRSTSSRRRCG
eukprot:SAG22_NODE_2079_length_3040_cov_1.415845_2_plen_376_part_00